MRRDYLIFASSVVLVLAAGFASAQAWDIDKQGSTDYAGKFFINTCTDPWQKVELEGVTNMHFKARKELDEGGVLKAYDLILHTNHQGVSGIGYDLVMDPNTGKAVKPLQKAKDADGNFITTSYQVPGTFNINKQIHPNSDNEFVLNGTYMCKLVSAGPGLNMHLHWNASLRINAAGETTLDFENCWFRCSGPGEDAGVVDCDADPPGCTAPDLSDYMGS